MHRFGRYISQIEQWAARGLDLLYPRSAGCPLCGAYDCSCSGRILNDYRERTACRRCGKFLSEAGPCNDCGSRGSGFPDRVWALAAYEGSLREALHRFKYHGDKRAGRFLAGLLLAGPGTEADRPDLVIPVPLHPSRLRQRGYNQAMLLAESLAKDWQVELDHRILQRSAITQPQSNLGRSDRLANLDGAFRLAAEGRVRGKKVLLVDDIITTGSTLEACGAVLRQAGPVGLQAVCVAAGRQGARGTDIFS